MDDNCLGSIALELSAGSKESSSVSNLINRLGIEVVMLQSIMGLSEKNERGQQREGSNYEWEIIKTENCEITYADQTARVKSDLEIKGIIRIPEKGMGDGMKSSIGANKILLSTERNIKICAFI